MIWVLLPLENLVHLGNWFCAQRERTQPFGWLAGGRREGVHYPQHHLNRGAQSAGRTSDPSDLQPPEQFNGAGRSERNCWSYDDTVESFGIHEQVDTLLGHVKPHSSIQPAGLDAGLNGVMIWLFCQPETIQTHHLHTLAWYHLVSYAEVRHPQT